MKSFFPGIILSALPFGALFAQTPGMMAFSGATLIDGTGGPPLPRAVVVIEGDRIMEVGPAETVRIPRDATLIDVSGKFILPGLIDTHLHLEMVGLSDVGDLPPEWRTGEKLRQLASTNARLDFLAGFTTVRDLGSTPAVLTLRDEINAGRQVGPRILAAGMQLVRKSAEADNEPAFLEYEGVQDARAKVRSLVSLGVDVIKIRLTHIRPVPSLEEVRSIVDEAHRFRLRATVHTDVPADDLVKLAIDAGADGIEHNAPLRSRDEQVLGLMARKGISLMAGSGAFYVQRIDTTGIIDSLGFTQQRLLPEVAVSELRKGIDSLHRQTHHMRNSGWDPLRRQESFIQEVQRARNAHVLLVFGTDCGGSGMVHGEQYKSLYGETRMGSTAMESIVMATRDAAIAIGKGKDLGTIEEGKIADLLVVDANPLTDLRNLHNVFRVIKGGRMFDPEDLKRPAR